LGFLDDAPRGFTPGYHLPGFQPFDFLPFPTSRIQILHAFPMHIGEAETVALKVSEIAINLHLGGEPLNQGQSARVLDCGGNPAWAGATPLSHARRFTLIPPVPIRPKAPAPMRSAGSAGVVHDAPQQQTVHGTGERSTKTHTLPIIPPPHAIAVLLPKLTVPARLVTSQRQAKQRLQ
jgi:hypothetical protein